MVTSTLWYQLQYSSNVLIDPNSVPVLEYPLNVSKINDTIPNELHLTFIVGDNYNFENGEFTI